MSTEGGVMGLSDAILGGGELVEQGRKLKISLGAYASGLFVLGNTVNAFFKEQKNVRTGSLKYMKTCKRVQKRTRKQCYGVNNLGRYSVAGL